MVKFCNSSGVLKNVDALYVLHNGVRREVRSASFGANVFYDKYSFVPIQRVGDDSEGMSFDETFSMPIDGLYKLIAIGSGGASTVYGTSGSTVVIGTSRSAGGGSGGCGMSHTPIRAGDSVRIAIVGTSAPGNKGNASIRVNGNSTACLKAFGFGGSNGNAQGNAGGAGGSYQYSDATMSSVGNSGGFTIASNPNYDEIEVSGGSAANPLYPFGIGQGGYFKGTWRPIVLGGNRFGMIRIERIGEYPFTVGGKWTVTFKRSSSGADETYVLTDYERYGEYSSWTSENPSLAGDGIVLTHNRTTKKWSLTDWESGDIIGSEISGGGAETSIKNSYSYTTGQVKSCIWSAT